MKRRILMLALFLSIVLFFSLNSVSFFPAERFAAAQNQWQSSNIDDYEIVVGVVSFSEWSQYRIVVRDGNIAEAAQRPSLFTYLAENPPLYDPSTFTSVDSTEVTNYTLDGLMTLASLTVASAPMLEIRACHSTPYWDAEYDSEYGYVSSLRFHCGGGFLGCAISDCDGGYTVLSFTPLSP